MGSFLYLIKGSSTIQPWAKITGKKDKEDTRKESKEIFDEVEL